MSLAKEMVGVAIKIKQELIRLHKHRYGVGPEDAYVEIIRNMVVGKFYNCLTPLELSLLERDPALVSQLRSGLKGRVHEDTAIEEIAGSPLLEAAAIINYQDKSVYFMFVFSEDIYRAPVLIRGGQTRER
jgi:uncharacterized protein YbcI